jgi:hypothetical protein
MKVGGEEDPFRVLWWQDDVWTGGSGPQKVAIDDNDL